MRIVTADLSSGAIYLWDLLDDHTMKMHSTYDAYGRVHSVQRMAKLVHDGCTYLACGRKGGILDVLSVDDGLHLISRSDLDHSSSIVSLSQHEEHLYIYMTNGRCYKFSIDALLLKSSANTVMHKVPSMSGVSFVQSLPLRDEWVVITGGKDKDIMIVDIGNKSVDWRSKNVKYSSEKCSEPYLFRPPFWIQNAVVVNNDDDVKIVAGSRFGSLLIYNTSTSRMPIDEIMITGNPIKHLFLIDKSTIFIADSFNNGVIFDLKTLKIVNKFEIKTGALSSMEFINLPHEGEQKFCILATSDVDNKLRVYSVDNNYKRLVAWGDLRGVATAILMLDDIPEGFFDDTETLTSIKKSRLV